MEGLDATLVFCDLLLLQVLRFHWIERRCERNSTTFKGRVTTTSRGKNHLYYQHNHLMGWRTDPPELSARNLQNDRVNRGGVKGSDITMSSLKACPTTISSSEVRANRQPGSGRRHFEPSVKQVGMMVASCLPLEKSLLFEETLFSQCGKFKLQGGATSKDPGASRLGYLSKCPVECIEQTLEICFPGRDVLITRLSCVDDYHPVGGCQVSGPLWLQFYVMDCILNTSKRPPRSFKACYNAVLDSGTSNMAPVPMKIAFSSDTKSAVEDESSRAVVAAISEAGIFYSSHERVSALLANGRLAEHDRPYVPMDIAWLRMQSDDSSGDSEKRSTAQGSRSWFRRGGYVDPLFESSVSGEDAMPRIWKIVLGARTGQKIMTRKS